MRPRSCSACTATVRGKAGGSASTTNAASRGEAGERLREVGLRVQRRDDRLDPLAGREPHPAAHPRFSQPKMPPRFSVARRGGAGLGAASRRRASSASAFRSASGVSRVARSISVIPFTGSSKLTLSRHSSSSLKSIRRPVAAAGSRIEPRNSLSTMRSDSPW